MFIAQEKKKKNIAEYLLYMWQIEAIIRACKLNVYFIEESVISRYNLKPTQHDKVMTWYKELIQQMKLQGITKSGHFSELNEIIQELLMLHNMLINLFKDKKYLELYAHASPNIDALLAKSGTTKLSEIEICLNGLYGIMHLKLQKKKISNETLVAIETFSKMLAFLTKKYHEMKAGKFTLPETIRN